MSTVAGSNTPAFGGRQSGVGSHLGGRLWCQADNIKHGRWFKGNPPNGMRVYMHKDSFSFDRFRGAIESHEDIEAYAVDSSKLHNTSPTSHESPENYRVVLKGHNISLVVG